MTRTPSSVSSGVEWLVFRVRLVPVFDESGRQLYELWNSRVPARKERRIPLGTVRAETKAEALALARKRFRNRNRDPQGRFVGVGPLDVQSVASAKIDREERPAIYRNRTPPKRWFASKRKEHYAKATP